MTTCSGKYQARAGAETASVAAPAQRPARRRGEILIVEARKANPGDSVRSMNPTPPFEQRTVDELTIGDERSFRHVALYADLKEVLRQARYPFRILPRTPAPRPDRALLLNLTFWAANAGGDVLVDERIEADVVTHAAWHHLAARALAPAPGKRPSVAALFL